MKTAWKTERCSTRPEELQRISEDSFIQRRNIHEVEGTEEIPNGGYECECRRISEDVLAQEQTQSTLERVNFLEDAMAELLIAEMDTQAILSSQDDALAEILLNQMEG